MRTGSFATKRWKPDCGGGSSSFGPPRKVTHPEFPFWHLQTDGLREIPERENLPKKNGGTSVLPPPRLDHPGRTRSLVCHAPAEPREPLPPAAPGGGVAGASVSGSPEHSEAGLSHPPGGLIGLRSGRCLANRLAPRHGCCRPAQHHPQPPERIREGTLWAIVAPIGHGDSRFRRDFGRAPWRGQTGPARRLGRLYPNPHPFVWAATPQSILKKIDRCKRMLATQH